MKHIFILIIFLTNIIYANTMQEIEQAYKQKDYDKASKLLLVECEKYNGYACALYGELISYDLVKNVKPDIETIRPYLEKACNLKDSYGCFLLGASYSKNSTMKDITVDSKKAKEYLSRSCSMNFQKACAGLIAEVQEGCFEKKDPEDCLTVSTVCNTYGYEICSKLTKTPKELYEEACKAGYTHRCVGTGDIYAQKSDFYIALKYYDKACKAKIGSGCKRIDQLFADKENKNLALKCLNNDNRACEEIGYNFEHGNTVAQNHDAAVSFYAHLCYKGDLDYCNIVGLMHSKKSNYSSAIFHYSLACQGDDMVGCYNQGVAVYNSKKGGKSRYQYAKKYLQKSCEGGYDKACSELNVLEELIKKQL